MNTTNNTDTVDIFANAGKLVLTRRGLFYQPPTEKIDRWARPVPLRHTDVGRFNAATLGCGWNPQWFTQAEWTAVLTWLMARPIRKEGLDDRQRACTLAWQIDFLRDRWKRRHDRMELFKTIRRLNKIAKERTA